MTSDEKSEKFEIIRRIWNGCKPDYLCNRDVIEISLHDIIRHCTCLCSKTWLTYIEYVLEHNLLNLIRWIHLICDILYVI